MQGLDFGPRPRTDNPMKERMENDMQAGVVCRGIYIYRGI